MKKFSKMFAFILVMVLSCLFIVACSNSDDDDDENESLSVWTSIDSYDENNVKCVDTYTLTLYSSSFTLALKMEENNKVVIDSKVLEGNYINSADGKITFKTTKAARALVLTEEELNEKAEKEAANFSDEASFVLFWLNYCFEVVDANEKVPDTIGVLKDGKLIWTDTDGEEMVFTKN